MYNVCEMLSQLSWVNKLKLKINLDEDNQKPADTVSDREFSESKI